MQLKIIQDTLSFISKNGYEKDSSKFLKSTAVFLAELFGVNYVIIDKFSLKTPTITESIIFYSKGKILPNIPYKLENTPCQNVINNKVCSYPTNVSDIFPKDDFLAQNNIESYIGIPLWSSSKGPIGLIAIMDDKPKSVKEIDTITTVLEIIAIKVEKVLEKMLLEDQLNLKIEELKIAKLQKSLLKKEKKNLKQITKNSLLQLNKAPIPLLLPIFMGT
ncbi:MAG: hypothetical protein GZ086_15215 [Gelidibacter sp.]|nr:hypothetical protein [Gelidibacter sp.]